MQTLSHFGKQRSATALSTLPNGKPNSSSIVVRQLSKSELLSLKQEMQDSLKQLQALTAIQNER